MTWTHTLTCDRCGDEADIGGAGAGDAYGPEGWSTFSRRSKPARHFCEQCTDVMRSAIREAARGHTPINDPEPPQ